MNWSALAPLAGLGLFLYSLAHNAPLAVVTGAALLSYVILARGHRLVRLLIVAVLIAAIHDALTGEIPSHLTDLTRL
jgi:hypothetical protein